MDTQPTPDVEAGNSPREPEAAEPIQIPSDALPDGIAKGDTLVCTGTDENGCTFELKKAEAEEEDGEEKWAEDIRGAMSPTAETED